MGKQLARRSASSWRGLVGSLLPADDGGGLLHLRRDPPEPPTQAFPVPHHPRRARAGRQISVPRDQLQQNPIPDQLRAASGLRDPPRALEKTELRGCLACCRGHQIPGHELGAVLEGLFVRRIRCAQTEWTIRGRGSG
jgi:hypothetical protein